MKIYLLCLDFRGDNDNIPELKEILKNFKDSDLNLSLVKNRNFSNIEEKLSKYFNTQLKRIERKYKFEDEYLGYNYFNDFESYKKKKIELKEKSNIAEKKWYKEYKKRMGYRKIQPSRSLLK